MLRLEAGMKVLERHVTYGPFLERLRSASSRVLLLDYDGTQAIGRTMNRGEVHSRPCTHALVVLKYAGASRYYVLTSYRECR